MTPRACGVAAVAEQQKTSAVPSSECSKHSDEPGVRLIDPELPAPNFFIVGAAKAGTTSLNAYLSQHPEVFMSAVKEPHYFSTFEVKPEFDNFIGVIRDSSAYQNLFLGSAGYKAIGEASPSYLCDAAAATRISSAIPNAKTIISLRNPVRRAYSHYLMEFHRGRETLPFRDALEADQSRKEKGWGVSFQYVELGLYADQVERYLESFGRERVLIILFEDLVREAEAVMQGVARFLEIDPARFPESAFDRAHNSFEASRGAFARAVLRNRPIRILSKRWISHRFRTAVRNRVLFKNSDKPVLDRDIRQWLAECFAADVRRLERLLGRDLSALREND